MNNKHDLKTIKDIVDVVTAENIDNFLIDLRGFLTMIMVIKSTQELVGKENIEIKKEHENVFHWIDDGKTEAHIHIEVKD